MTALLVGVLVEIPPDVIPFYKRVARETHQSFEDVVAEDVIALCAKYFVRVAKEEAARRS